MAAGCCTTKFVSKVLQETPHNLDDNALAVTQPLVIKIFLAAS